MAQALKAMPRWVPAVGRSMTLQEIAEREEKTNMVFTIMCQWRATQNCPLANANAVFSMASRNSTWWRNQQDGLHGELQTAFAGGWGRDLFPGRNPEYVPYGWEGWGYHAIADIPYTDDREWPVMVGLNRETARAAALTISTWWDSRKQRLYEEADDAFSAGWGGKNYITWDYTSPQYEWMGYGHNGIALTPFLDDA